jgi:predicted RNA-binding protein associated with RNAse of E/G family
MSDVASVCGAMPIMTAITVIKRKAAGEEVWRYSGFILRREPNMVVLEARFRSPDLNFMGIVLQTDDRFIETYFTDRWYNIYEIHDREDDRLKGWYCNIAYPAVWEADDLLSYRDLALDLWVASDGVQTVLDEDEFTALNLEPATRLQALAALDELRALFFKNKQPVG